MSKYLRNQQSDQAAQPGGRVDCEVRPQIELPDCHDCGVNPGQPHYEGCDVERCSVCGMQRLMCEMTTGGCKHHDPLFARWTGLFPGEAEAKAIGIDLNEFYRIGLNKIFFIKPKSA